MFAWNPVGLALAGSGIFAEENLATVPASSRLKPVPRQQ